MVLLPCETPAPVTALDFSSAKEEFLAVGDGSGTVRVYATGGGGMSLLETAIQLGELERFVSAAQHGDD